MTHDEYETGHSSGGGGVHDTAESRAENGLGGPGSSSSGGAKGKGKKRAEEDDDSDWD